MPLAHTSLNARVEALAAALRAMPEPVDPAARELRRAAEALLDALAQPVTPHRLHDVVQVDYQPVALATGVAARFDPIARERGLFLSTIVDPALPPRLLGPGAKLTAVLRSLVSNAIKYTERGGVRVRLLRVDREDEFVRFEVRDSGIGLEPGRTTGEASHAAAGDELDLAAARRTVEAIGSHLEVRSRAGVGTTFWFDLPLRELTTPGPEAFEAVVGGWRGVGRVLLVEDGKVNRLVVLRQLEAFGLDVTAVEDGAQALLALAREPFDVVFMDCQMAGMTGYEATAALRAADGPNRNVPIVALTAHTDPGDERRCRDAGMSDYVGKPARPAALVRMLARWLPDEPTEKAA